MNHEIRDNLIVKPNLLKRLERLTFSFSLTFLMNSAYLTTFVNFLGFNLDFRDENA